MQSPDIKKALQASRSFQYLEPHEIDMLVSYCKVVSFQSGQHLVSQGKTPLGMGIILEGRATVAIKVLGRDTIELKTLEPGQFFGEVSLLDKYSSPYTVTALTDVECLFISRDYFDMLRLFFSNNCYRITRAIVEGVVDRLMEMQRTLKDLIGHSHVTKHSFFSELMHVFSHPQAVSFEDAGIDIHQMKCLPFLNTLSDKEYLELLKYSVLIFADTHCNVIKEGEIDTPIYFIIRGAVQSSVTQNNKFAKLSVIGDSNIFGSVSIVNHSPSIFTYRTCERSIFLKMSSANLQLLHNDDIELWYKIFGAISQSFVELEQSADKLLMRLNSELYTG